MPEFLNYNCSKVIDCKQGAVRAVRYNGKYGIRNASTIGFLNVNVLHYSGRQLLPELRLR